MFSRSSRRQARVSFQKLLANLISPRVKDYLAQKVFPEDEDEERGATFDPVVGRADYLRWRYE
jgi:hypothetical protein